MDGHAWIVKNKDQAKAFAKWIIDQEETGKEYVYSIKGVTRTPNQNAALHATFRRLAQGLNDAGYDMKSDVVTKREIPWTESSVKEVLFKPIIEHMFEADSTTKLTVEELSDSVETLLREIAKRTGVVVSFTEEA